MNMLKACEVSVFTGFPCFKKKIIYGERFYIDYYFGNSKHYHFSTIIVNWTIIKRNASFLQNE